MSMERLDKLIASMGQYSRRDVARLVRAGRIAVDGITARSPDLKCDPQDVQIAIDGQPLAYTRYTDLMMHKPAGVLSATEDGHSRTVLDLLPPELQKRGLFPVGRLDRDTEGLLLLSNDGPLAHALLSPKHHVDKVYYAQVDGTLDETDVAAFAAGMTLGDGLVCMPAGLEPLEDGACLVTLHEGKFHQVKRMLAARGAPVRYLKRLRMGPLSLDETLSPGEYRPLTPEESRQLRQAVNRTEGN